MTTRQWKLVVTEIGTSAPAAEAVVEAPNWMAGIKAARGRIGEPESIPQGASCTVAPDGRVTVFDAARRRSYVLTPLGGAPGSEPAPAAARFSAPMPSPAAPTAVSASPFAVQPAPLPTSAVPAAAPAPSAARQRPKTMAYILDGPLPGQASVQPIPVGAPARPSQVDTGRIETQTYATEGRPTAPAAQAAPAPQIAPAPQVAPAPVAPPTQVAQPMPAAPEPAPSGRALRRTMAFVPGQFDLPPLPTREVVVGARATTPAQAPEPARISEPTQSTPVLGRPSAASAPSREVFRVLFDRDVPPSDESPLHYHVVGVHASSDRSTTEYERAMHAELERVRAGIAEPRDGHFIQVFVYREPLDEPAEDAEVARLQWRGWRAESVVRFPKLEAQVSLQTIPGAERYPTAEGDPRLADLLDAFEDVWFLATPAAGLEFAARVLADLFPNAHVLCAGLPLDGRGFVPSSVHGSLGGYTAPSRIEPTGLVQLALAGAGRPIAFPDPAADARIDVAVEGIGTGPLLAAVAPHAGEALGYVRIARSKASPAFTLVDSEILRAVVERLGLFLRLRGACLAAS